jgi:outer membrane protein OmpA-like peptidoglycan-associated protein
LLLLVFAIFVVPPIVQRQLQQRLTQELQREVSVGPLRINPLALAVTSRDFRITDHDGSRLLGWERLHVNFELRSLWSDAWVFRRVQLLVPEGRLLVRADGSLNIADIIDRAKAGSAESRPSAAPKPVRIEELDVQHARLEFEDHSQTTPFVTTIGPATFTLQNFVTAGNDDAPYAFDGVSEVGERFTWSGAINITPVRSTGTFSVERLFLPKYAAYAQSMFHGQLRDGRLTVHGRYTLDLSPGQRRAELNGALLQLDQLVIAPSPAHDPSLEVVRLNITGIEAKLEPMQVQIDTVSIQGGAVTANRSADGAIDLLYLWSKDPAAAPSSNESPPSQSAPLAAQVAHIAVNDFGFAWKDESTPQTAQARGVLERLDIREFNLAPGSQAEVRARVRLDPSGVVAMDARLGLDPLRIIAQTEVESIPLGPISPYVEALSGVRITRGSLGLSGKLEADQDSPTVAPNVRWDGFVTVADLATTAGAENDPLLRFERLDLREISARSNTRINLRVGEVDLLAPNLHAVVGADGTLNFAELAKRASPDEPAEEIRPPVDRAHKPAADTSPVITIGRTRIRNGSVAFRDRSVRPAVNATVQQIQADVGQLSSARMDRADMKVECQIAEIGRVSANGHINPLNPAAVTAFTISVRDVDLKPIGPYVAKYAGYALDRGRLDLDLDYRIENRALLAKNLVKLDQFTLGAPSGSRDATSLPVTLAIALLKDRQGMIEINLPIEGSLDDPTFRLGRVIGRVIANVLTRAATSPFALLGALVPGGDAQADLSQVLFPAGLAELDEGGRKAVGQLARILEERPALRVELTGGVDAEADLAGLQRQRLDHNVRRYVWAQRRSTTPNLPPPEQLDVAPAERERILRTWYRQRLAAERTAAQAPVQPGARAPAVARADTTADAAPGLTGPERSIGRPGAGSPNPFRRMMRALGFSRSSERIDTADEIAAQARGTGGTIGAADVPLADVEARLASELAVDEVEVQALSTARARAVRSALLTTVSDAQRILIGASQATGTRVSVALK